MQLTHHRLSELKAPQDHLFLTPHTGTLRSRKFNFLDVYKVTELSFKTRAPESDNDANHIKAIAKVS